MEKFCNVKTTNTDGSAATATDDKGGVSTSAARTVRVVGAAQAREIYYIHSDHLNTPRLITNKDKQPVWRNAPLSEPFGAGAPEEDPENTGTRFSSSTSGSRGSTTTRKLTPITCFCSLKIDHSGVSAHPPCSIFGRYEQLS